jgi:thiol-disulfide isomerase/thioredoxin
MDTSKSYEDLLVVVSASTCGHCKKIYPMLSELAERLSKIKYGLIFLNEPTMNFKEGSLKFLGSLEFYPTFLALSLEKWHSLIDGSEDMEDVRVLNGIIVDKQIKLNHREIDCYDVDSIMNWISEEEKEDTEFADLLDEKRYFLESLVNKEALTIGDVYQIFVIVKDIRKYVGMRYGYMGQNALSYMIDPVMWAIDEAISYPDIDTNRKEIMLILRYLINNDIVCTTDLDIDDLAKILAGESVVDKDETISTLIGALSERIPAQKDYELLLDFIREYAHKLL